VRVVKVVLCMPGSDLRVRKGLYIYRIFPGAEFVPRDVLPSICLNPLITLPEDLKITAFLRRLRHSAPLLHPVVKAKAFCMVRYSNNFQLDQFGVTGCSLVRGMSHGCWDPHRETMVA
jgi:hypothetical protein